MLDSAVAYAEGSAAPEEIDRRTFEETLVVEEVRPVVV